MNKPVYYHAYAIDYNQRIYINDEICIVISIINNKNTMTMELEHLDRSVTTYICNKFDLIRIQTKEEYYRTYKAPEKDIYKERMLEYYKRLRQQFSDELRRRKERNTNYWT